MSNTPPGPLYDCLHQVVTSFEDRKKVKTEGNFIKKVQCFSNRCKELFQQKICIYFGVLRCNFDYVNL